MGTAHALAMLLLTGTIGALPLLKWPVWALNYLLLVKLASILDRAVGFKSVYPTDIVLVAEKRDAE